VLLRSLAYEELLRYGEAPHLVEALAALRETAEAVADEPDLKAYFEDRARCLAAAAEGQVPEPLSEADAYPVAMALLGRGAKYGDKGALDRAIALLDALRAQAEGTPGAIGFHEELDLVRRWRARAEDPERTARPPLPFDGMP
jgi:hypothetical protein